jgi:hypothetical protein
MNAVPMRAVIPIFFACSLCVAAAQAEGTATRGSDRYRLSVHGETHAALFQRALLPGTYGAVISDETLLPVYQYARISARDLALETKGSGLDMELSAWWRGELATSSNERGADGDVQAANVGYRYGRVATRIGRQHVAGGAARYSRFVLMDAELGAGLDVRVYAGLSVLPRWNERPGYTYLGAAADSRLKDPAFSSGTRERGSYWLVGTRLGWTATGFRSGLSFHEQREPGGLARRTLTLDGTGELGSSLNAGASASAELEAGRLSEARAWLEATLAGPLDVTVEWLHTEPALFLSRQSVLSVFSTADYDEGGARATARASERITIEGGAWAELYSGSRPGARSEVAMRLVADRSGNTFVRVAYARVLTPDNGYHSLRSSLLRRISNRVSGTVEAYAYLYDNAIKSYRSSTVYSGTLEYRPSPALGLLCGASLVRSPYANLDAQAQVRVAYDFDFATTRGGR